MAGIEELLRYAINQGVFSEESAIGCSDSEIEELRRDQCVSKLPASYVTFLRRIGRGAGRLLRGTDAFYPEILGVKTAAQELLLEDSSEEQLDQESFVIAMHQGYQVFWFPSVIDEEPSVLMYQEGNRRRIREWEDFSLYLEDMISEVDRT